MAIDHGALVETVSGANSDPITIAVNPSVAPVGALVKLAHGQVDTDLVTGAVTYGGVAMTRRVTIADTTGTDPHQRGRVYIYALEGNVPPGAQNVVINRTGTAVIWATVCTQTGNAAMEVLSVDSEAMVTDPAVTLTRQGRASLGYIVGFSSTGQPSNLGTPAGWSRAADHDFGDYCAAMFRESVTSTADGTYTITQAPSNNATCAIVVAEAVGAPPPSGTSDHCCGAECGIVGPDVVGAATGHWHIGEGPCVSQTGRARHGGRAFRFAANDEFAYRGRLITGTQRWERFYLYFETLPDRNVGLYRIGPAAGDACNIVFRVATQDIVGAIGAQVAITAPQPVVAGRWYRIDCLGDVSANPRTMKLRVCVGSPSDPLADGPSIDRGTASFAQAASTFTEFRLGAATSQRVVATVVVDDHLTGAGVTGYPAGASTITAVQPVSDGAHNYNAAGDFRGASGDLGLAATTAYTRLVGLLIDATSFLHANTAAAGEYLEFLVGSVPAMSSVRAIEIVSVHKGATAAAHKQTLRWLEGAGSVDVFTDADFSELTLVQHSKHYVAMPDSDPPTTALLNTSKFRWGSSWTSVLTGGQIAGLMLEIDGVPTGSPPPPPGSEETNPTHEFPVAGTYPVTLTVRDNDGLTDSVTQMVTVP